VDRERNALAGDLQATGMVETTYRVFGSGPTRFGLNGEGDRYETDGEILVCVLAQDDNSRSMTPPSPLHSNPDRTLESSRE
jgi:hypothetical protein